ncbi:MAG: hypothetical protein IEMM0002_0211 [bacterium]|nr:MAG: hypothetical protein IEMM0002_0211 [bacterium]
MRKFAVIVFTLCSLTSAAGCESFIYGEISYPADMKDSTAGQEGKTGDISAVEIIETIKTGPVEQKSGEGHSALVYVFPVEFDTGWDNILEAMLDLPLMSVDKSSGILITGWINNKGVPKKRAASINIFGGSSKLVRYKYVVRVYDLGAVSKVKVIPFTQVMENRRWRVADPEVMVSEKLMKRIITKMEE